ncbi:hypothetical protein OIU79_030918 [Salix purpurea]|uniref:Uncharacterized protein n=1 Tax=Salix purpurea TaxID=77065 RepID=A0A9Q0ZS94_SALPP|nr:hypothetical protein OIU79_030918 [Salix purpurea]
MDSASTKIRMATLPKRHSHRLLFDRRYGWVFDEWKDPSEEALAGGRGMFCILPLAKAFLTAASQSIDKTANFAVKVFDSPDLLSSQALQTSLRNQLKQIQVFHKKSRIQSFCSRRTFITSSHFPSSSAI